MTMNPASFLSSIDTTLGLSIVALLDHNRADEALLALADKLGRRVESDYAGGAAYSVGISDLTIDNGVGGQMMFVAHGRTPKNAAEHFFELLETSLKDSVADYTKAIATAQNCGTTPPIDRPVGFIVTTYDPVTDRATETKRYDVMMRSGLSMKRTEQSRSATGMPASALQL